MSGPIKVLIEEKPTVPTSRSGPRPKALRIDRDRGRVLGLDFGETYMGAGLLDLGGREVVPRRYIAFRAARNHRGALQWMKQQAQELVDDPRRLVGIGISMAAPVRASSGRAETLREVVRDERAMPDWAGVNPAHELDAVLQWDVAYELDNDATLAALAELRWGAARGLSDALFVKWTSGIGAALILDGDIRRGCGGVAGELGHVEVVSEQGAGGPICSQCERTCLQTLASVPDLLRDAGLGSYEGLGLYQGVKDLASAIRDGDRIATEALKRACDHVGRVIASAVTILNPQAVILGGDFDVDSYDLVAPSLRASIRAHSTSTAFRDMSLVPGRQTGKASFMGAAALVLDNHLFDYAQRLGSGHHAR